MMTAAADNKDDVRQQLLAQKETLKKSILEKLTELYLLRSSTTNSAACPSPRQQQQLSPQTTTTPTSSTTTTTTTSSSSSSGSNNKQNSSITSLFSNVRDDDLLSEQKFSQLLNLKADDEHATQLLQQQQHERSNHERKSSVHHHHLQQQDEVVPMELDTTTSGTTIADKPSTSSATVIDENGLKETDSTTTTTTISKVSAINTDQQQFNSSNRLGTADLSEYKQVGGDVPSKITRSEHPTIKSITTSDLHKKRQNAESTPMTQDNNHQLLHDKFDKSRSKDNHHTNDAHSTSYKSHSEKNATATSTISASPTSPASLSPQHLNSSATTPTTLSTKPAFASNRSSTLTSTPATQASPSRFPEMQQKPKHRVDDSNDNQDYRLERDDDKRIRLDHSRVISPKEPLLSHDITVSNAENHQKQIFERAKHEAAVTARIAELRKQGLWSAKRLPKLQEPPRPKTHWDYLLEEMRWLSSDFDAERKWKRKAAKKCALMVYRYHQEKRYKQERAEREHLQHIKKVAAAQAKEIRSFWSSIEKIVDFRQQTKLEETRKKAWGLHLNYILDQTSKFSNTCLEDNNKTTQPPTPQQQEPHPNNDEPSKMECQDGENVEKEPVIKSDEQTKSKHEVEDIAAGAQSIQPKGNTLETTTVNTKVPFLLKHSLREYQHIGLDWLVNMYNKKLNGILADEMGLGKTIQTIALLAHLACEKGDWGPHLIVVPTSVMLNWEMEFKKWCPAFKILTYYGNPKERRMKRVGWSRPNSFHICITSYRIVIQDHAAFRRKKWCYFILDEAHYIKNFKSQRWQMLLNFNSARRLLLTGTPLQNDLMELWSLMHFLMPNLFDSYREFKDWFVNPLTEMVEDSSSQEHNQELVQRLHKILRPFLLRRLKSDVEKQLPAKHEVNMYCRLSKRQRFLYEEFMSLNKTKETLASGNFLSVINVLMQLRKVCNHPNLFEPRPTLSPFMMRSIIYHVPGIVTTPLDYNPSQDVNLSSLQLLLAETGNNFTSSASEYIRRNKVPKVRLVEELDRDEPINPSPRDEDEPMFVEVDEVLEAINCDKINEAYSALTEKERADRKLRLNFMSETNDARCSNTTSVYYKDLEDRFKLNKLPDLMKSWDKFNSFSSGNGRILCSLVSELKNTPKHKLEYLTSLLSEVIKSPEEIVQSMSDLIDRFVFCIPGVSAPSISLHVSHYSPSKKVQEVLLQKSLYEDLSPRFDFMSKVIVNMKTSFPELRLIQYDCGKLQTLSRLLNDLKAKDHRVLIFTQMSRMLDILEQFLNYHGHTYLRLDGATKVDQRQILMERFNNDRKIFCFILSTRSGGIGVNLTGADTVIFYDSDWNPTMDAQAQDRCHRIGQTRDVYIYRLICEDTIEERIFKKAKQKQKLGFLAIEEGNFNTSGFTMKRDAIQELFDMETNKDSPEEVPMEVDESNDDNGKSEMTKAQLVKLEQALSKGEAEAGEDLDVDAIKVARADVDTDLREFDESIPITEENSPVPEQKSEKEQQIDMIVSQMIPVEQYAVRFLESLQKPKNKEELEQAEKEYRMELENKKSQWEQSRIEMLKEQSINNETNETMLTYPRGAKCDHVQYLLDGERTVEDMPLWAPPTPPTSPPSPVEESNQYHYQPAMTPAMAARINAMGGLGSIFGFGSDSNKQDMRHFIDEKDVYVDFTAHFFYEPNIMLESQLPPINQQYSDNETTSYTIGAKKIRLTGAPIVPGGYYQSSNSQLPHLQQHLQNLTNIPTTPDGSVVALTGQQSIRKPKVRRDEVICLPKSIFDRQTPNFAKIRRELKLQKLRCVTKGNDSDPFAMQKFFHTFSLNPLGQSLQQETIVTSVNRQMQQYNNPNILLAYHQDHLPPWSVQEEWGLLMILQHLQDLPVNLCILTPGHTPNWELVSEVISDIGFIHRSYKMCEYHFVLNVQKREMTRDSNWDDRSIQSSNINSDSPQPPAKKSKKHKNLSSSGTPNPSEAQSSQQSSSSKSNSSAPTIPFKPSKTGQMLNHDKSLSMAFSKRYDFIQRMRQNRAKHVRTRFSTTSRERFINQPTNLVREDRRLIDYERPLKPEIIIVELAEEKKRRALAARAAAQAQAQAMAQAQVQQQQHQQQCRSY